MTKKTRRILRIVCMLALTVFLFWSVNLLFMPKYIEENKDGRITAEFYREKLNNDILFVGSSTVYSGINPIVLWEKYGLTSYDRSNSSQTPWISYYMIKDALACSDPKAVVLDVGFFYAEDTYVEEPENRKSLDNMRISKEKFQCIREAMSPDENYMDYIFPIFRFHTRWKYLTAEDWKYLYYKPDVTHNGYVYTGTVEGAQGDAAREGLDEVRLPNRSALFLENILSLCRDNGLDLLLIKTPSYRAKWGQDYEDDIRFVADPYGVEYVDFDRFTDEIGLDYAEDTSDGGGHLNDAGAAKFTAYLGNYLLDRFPLTDHRNDPAYEKVWKEKCERYHHGK